MIVKNKKVILKNNLEIELRSPTSGDAQNILDMLKKVAHESYKNMNSPKDKYDNFALDDEAKILTEFTLADDRCMISAFYKHTVIGNLGLFGIGGPFLKHNARIGMGIEKNFHNIGLGSELIRCAFDNALCALSKSTIPDAPAR